MNNRIKESFKGIERTIKRYPMAVIQIILLYILNRDMQLVGVPYEAWGMTLAFGVILSILLERYMEYRKRRRIVGNIVMGMSIITLGVYSAKIGIGDIGVLRLYTASSIMYILYMFLPTERGMTVGEMLILNIKGLFITMIYTGVLLVGVTAIMSLVSLLLFPTPPSMYMDTIRIITGVFGPIKLLSMLDVCDRDREESGEGLGLLERITNTVVAPILLIITIIISIYVVTAIVGRTWGDLYITYVLNIYTIITLLVYFIVEKMGGKVTDLYRRIYPKVLAPIGGIQLINTIYRIQTEVLSVETYYGLVFGIYAMMVGVLILLKGYKGSTKSIMILVVLLTLTIVPKLDAYTLVGSLDSQSRIGGTQDKTKQTEQKDVDKTKEMVYFRRSREPGDVVSVGGYEYKITKAIGPEVDTRVVRGNYLVEFKGGKHYIIVRDNESGEEITVTVKEIREHVKELDGIVPKEHTKIKKEGENLKVKVIVRLINVGEDIEEGYRGRADIYVGKKRTGEDNFVEADEFIEKH